MKRSMLIILNWFLLVGIVNSLSKDNPNGCAPSLTTASGTSINKNKEICSGDLIFEDNFDTLDFDRWQHENTLAGGGNWEFQWYVNNRSNSFVEDGNLHIRPTLTSDVLGEKFLYSGNLNIHGGSPADECTNPSYWGCERVGTTTNILNPIRSARLRTFYSFSFKYGKVEVRAKMPTGDWLWPSIWFMPKQNAYGTWPASGEIDLVESRGNMELFKDGENIGNQHVASTLHFGPYPNLNAYKTSHFERNSKMNFASDFHSYQMEWTPEKIKFSIDDEELGSIPVGKGMWARGGFDMEENLDNPWKAGESMAPFDKEFYIIISLAVGGINYFPDDATNSDPKPWKNSSPQAATDFWNGRNSWLPTWNLNTSNGYDASLLVDYVRVYAV